MKKNILLLALTILLGNFVEAQSFIKGPYLLYPNNNTQMTVMWQLDASATSTISWGITKMYGNSKSVTEFGTDHQFKYTISGLNPATKYFYKVEAGETVKADSFYTAVADNDTNLIFYIYGDTRAHPETQNNVTGRILTEIKSDTASQTFCLITGDCVARGRTESDWQDQFFNSGYSNNENLKAIVPFLIARGNHENYNSTYSSGNATVFYKYWPYSFVSNSTNGNDMYYSFDYGPVHIAVLDQYNSGSYSPGKVSSAELSWLKTDLENTNKPWKFILLHEPGWSASSNSKSGHKNNVDVQNNIQPLCIEYGVQAVFGGHNHYYANCLVDSVHHFTLGGGGAPLYSPSYTPGGTVIKAESTYHFMKVDIEKNHAVLKVIRPDGTIVETINLALTTNSIINVSNKYKINVYPNPTKGKIIVEIKDYKKGTIEVKNIKGQTLLTKQIANKKTEFNLHGFPKGTYLIDVKIKNKSFRKKIILE